MGFRCLTYNTWHGLSGHKKLNFHQLEPKGRKEQRLQLQIREIQALQPDLVFFQEVSPLTSLAKRYANSFNMDEIHQAASTGVKLFQCGFPMGGFSGVATLAKKGLGLSRIDGVKLSGGMGWCSDWCSFQLSEFRYGLIGRIHHTDLGSLLLLNVHLHHGFEWSPSLRSSLDEKIEGGKITPAEYEKIKEKVQGADRRREEEIETLFQVVEKVRSPQDEIFFCGDFNMERTNPVYQKILDRGFFDTAEANQTPLAPTWDAKKNQDNHKLTQAFVMPLPDVSPEIQTWILEEDLKPRYLDYIFATEGLKKHFRSCQVFSPQDSSTQLMGSDHFGLVTDFC